MLLAFAGSTHSVHSLSRRFGTSRSSTYRYLEMLRRRQLIEAAPAAGHYRLGSRVVELARDAETSVDVVAVAEPVMRALAMQSGETVLLTRRVGHRVLCAACVESPQVVRIAYEPARDLPLHSGSAARIHLASLDDEEIEGVLARPREGLTPDTLTDPGRLRRELALIRRRGYATSAGEIDPGVRSVSVAVLAPSGQMVAGLTVAGPRFRLSARGVVALVPPLQDAARRIAARTQGAAGRARPPRPARMVRA
jgi:DNA-binding IclR family transcriptional regulator